MPTTTRSPAAAASAAVAAVARGPSSSTRSLRVSGPRELLNTTSYPAAAANRATVAPMFPLPIKPIVVISVVTATPSAQALEADLVCVKPRRQGHGPGSQLHADAELVRLQCCSSCQLLTRQSSGESQVILDPRRCSRLPAERGVLCERRGQALRCAVHRGRESRRSAADDEQVAHLGRTAIVWGRRRKSERVQ